MHQTVACVTSHVSFVWLRCSLAHRRPAGLLKAFCHSPPCFSARSISASYAETPAECQSAGSLLRSWRLRGPPGKGHCQTHAAVLKWNQTVVAVNISHVSLHWEESPVQEQATLDSLHPRFHASFHRVLRFTLAFVGGCFCASHPTACWDYTKAVSSRQPLDLPSVAN